MKNTLNEQITGMLLKSIHCEYSIIILCNEFTTTMMPNFKSKAELTLKLYDVQAVYMNGKEVTELLRIEDGAMYINNLTELTMCYTQGENFESISVILT